MKLRFMLETAERNCNIWKCAATVNLFFPVSLLYLILNPTVNWTMWIAFLVIHIAISIDLLFAAREMSGILYQDGLDFQEGLGNWALFISFFLGIFAGALFAQVKVLDGNGWFFSIIVGAIYGTVCIAPTLWVLFMSRRFRKTMLIVISGLP